MKRTPEPMERLYDYGRMDKEQRPDGRVLLVDDEEGFCTVVFPRVERRTDQCVRINGILHHENILLTNPELLYQGDYEKDYYFEEIQWSSNDGGKGAWLAY